MKQLNWYQIFGKSNIPDGRTVLPTDDIQIWLHCANIWDKTYTTLAEVLADTDTLLALISSNNAVDYMVRSTTWAVSSALVPKMTSNTAPEGLCYANTVQSGREPYMAFDENLSTEYWSTGTDDQYLGYMFATPKYVYEVKGEVINNTSSANLTTLKLRGSNDGVTYVDISDPVSYTLAANEYKSFTIRVNTLNTYKYIAILRTAGNNRYRLRSVQYYSESIPASATAMTYIGQNNYCANTLLADATWCETICNSEYFESVLNVKVPTMTSNTTPSGECLGYAYIDTAYYKAFDGNDSSYVGGGSKDTPNQRYWVGYHFTSSVCVKKAYIIPETSTSAAVYKVQGSNDGTNWDDLAQYSNSLANTTLIMSNNTTDYEYYRWYLASASSQFWWGANTVQFYGRKDV